MFRGLLGAKLAGRCYVGFGRASAEAEGTTIDWHEAPLDCLPFEDESFDVVTSSFGLIFADDAQAAITEAYRCLRTNGRLLFTARSTDGYMADMTTVMMDFLPEPARTAPAPMRWGDPHAVESLLGKQFSEISTTHHALPWRFDSADDATEFYFTHSPVHVFAAKAVGQRADSMRAAVRAHLASLATPDGKIDLEAAYTLTSARRI